MSRFRNPILTGFSPDPSALRVGDDYYIATSTYEWFPGIQIHHSQDLANWSELARPLDRVTQLDLAGCPDAGGVRVPHLSFIQGTFYLVFSIVSSFGAEGHASTFVVSAPGISGPWSEPTLLSKRGFGGSLFHDRDGRSWFLDTVHDPAEGKAMAGIILQEFSRQDMCLSGSPRKVFENGWQAQRLCRHGHVYYLLMAEAGSASGCALSVARSMDLTGPYESHPDNPLIASADDDTGVFRYEGAGTLLEDEVSRWWAVYQLGRRDSLNRRGLLGGETAIESVLWRDGWPFLASGSKEPAVEIDIEAVGRPKAFGREEFEGTIGPNLQSLMIAPSEDWASLTARHGHVRLFGRGSLSSRSKQSLLARRLGHNAMSATTIVDFAPHHPDQRAGLAYYLDSGNHICAYVTAADSSDGVRCIQICTFGEGKEGEVLHIADAIDGDAPVVLRGQLRDGILRFSVGSSENDLEPIGGELDARVLSGDYVPGGDSRYGPVSPGARVGIFCQDLTQASLAADFDWFDYQPMNPEGR